MEPCAVRLARAYLDLLPDISLFKEVVCGEGANQISYHPLFVQRLPDGWVSTLAVNTIRRRMQDVMDSALLPVPRAEKEPFRWTPHATRGAFYSKLHALGVPFDTYNSFRSGWASEQTPKDNY